MAFYPNGSPVFVPSESPNSIGVGIGSLADETSGANNIAIGLNAGSLLTTGANNVIIGPSAASTTLTTGSNNIIVGTSAAADAATSSTSNTMWIGGGSTAVLSATSINSTPAVTIPGSLTVTGAITGIGQSVGGSVGSVCTSAFSQASSATLAAVTGLSNTLIAGATYVFDIYLQGTAGASGGLKVSLGAGSATATSFASDSWLYNGSTVSGQTQSTSYSGNQVATTAAYTTCYITGTIVVNAGGTFIVEAAQNASNGTATTIAVNSYMVLTRIA